MALSQTAPCACRSGCPTSPSWMNLGKPADLSALPLTDPTLPRGVNKTGAWWPCQTRLLLKEQEQRQALPQPLDSFPAELCCEQNQPPKTRLCFAHCLQAGWEGWTGSILK